MSVRAARRGNSGRTLFFFNDTATTEIYTLSLHDALPIFAGAATLGLVIALGIFKAQPRYLVPVGGMVIGNAMTAAAVTLRSEEHTSELQSPCNLVCRLLLEKKSNARMGPHAGPHKRHLPN